MSTEARATRPPSATHLATMIASLDARGRGVARVDGGEVAIEGALTGEKVLYRRRRQRGDAVGEAVQVLEPAPERVDPVCAHFERCGGCRLQHMSHGAQLELKQRLLGAALESRGVEPESFLEPLVGPSTGYRRRARLGIRYVPGKGGVLAGFHEKFGTKVAELERCEVLHAKVGRAIRTVRDVLGRLDARGRLPQLEVALGDAAGALVLRHLEPLGAHDLGVLVEFAKRHDWHLYLQPAGLESVRALWPERPEPLRYALPDFDLVLEFWPTDFIQVNSLVNRALVAAAVKHLGLAGGERVLDLYCGIGNFTLPLARRAAFVLGVEGNPGLVARARANARHNGIENVSFETADLTSLVDEPDWWRGPWHRMLLDPPRSGAAHVLARLAPPYPQRIVYVSCNAQTLARDAGVLVAEKGYRLLSAGVVDMFPHTTHSEAMAVFEASPSVMSRCMMLTRGSR